MKISEKFKIIILIAIILSSNIIISNFISYNKSFASADVINENISNNKLLTDNVGSSANYNNISDSIYNTASISLNVKPKSSSSDNIFNDINLLLSKNKLIQKRDKSILNNNVNKFNKCLDNISADIVLVKNINSDNILMKRNEYYRWPIASITKLMTTLIVMQKYDFSKSVEITQDIINKVYPYNTFKSGERYSVNNLVRSAIVASSNDAAYALASIEGYKNFVNDMNKFAKKIGMVNTTFFEPSGLSYLNQSTANDLYILIKYIYNNYPALLNSSRRKSIVVRDLNSGKKYILKNVDKFAGERFFFGGKTGYIDESKQNLITLLQKNGKIFMVLVLGSENRFKDVKDIYNCI